MTIAQKVEMAATFRHVTKTSLASALGMTRQNFHMKLKRDTLTRSELEKIGEAMGGKYVVYFEFPDGTRV